VATGRISPPASMIFCSPPVRRPVPIPNAHI
jgi:hypothetical protein